MSDNMLMFPSWRQEGDKSSQLNDLATGIDLWAKRREVFSSLSSSRKLNVFLSWGILSSRQSVAKQTIVDRSFMFGQVICDPFAIKNDTTSSFLHPLD